MVVVSGPTGNLGLQIIYQLIKNKVTVRALVRESTSLEKQKMLRDLGVDVVVVNYDSLSSLTIACKNAGVVICALSGLREVIYSNQLQLFKAAVEAGVPRFIPSDFSIDFKKLPEGSNRNLDVRRDFMKAIEANKGIRVTSILNGAFTDMLAGTAPFILLDAKKILCWGNRDQLMDWTTVANTATFTALAAIDPSTPRFLKIAGDQISAQGLADVMSELTGHHFKVLRPGNLKMFSAIIAVIKFFTRKSNQLYPAWQGMQYMYNMYSGLAKFDQIDNDRYQLEWTTTREFLAEHLSSKKIKG